MEIPDSAQAEKKPEKKSFLLLAAVIIIAVFAFGVFLFLQQTSLPASGVISFGSNPESNQPLMKSSSETTTLDSTGTEIELIDPSQFLSREDYFRAVFMPHRETYELFEKAASFLGKPVSEMPAYFGMESEQEIFAALPSIPADFSEKAYLLAQGQYFALENLDERYYRQPEFYFNFKTGGVRYWTKPDPKYWVTNGYGTYPAEQWDVLKRGEREEFSAVVFFYTGWGAQTYQGISLRPATDSSKYFDIQITPKDFLLEPVFPKFKKNWAYKINITGKPKPDTPPGTYTIGLNVEVPPKELKSQWAAAHPNLYFDGASGIRPSGTQIQLNITVN